MRFDASMWVKEGDYVEHDDGRWGHVIELVWGDHGMLGSNLDGYIVEIQSGERVEFNWIHTTKLSAIEVMARL